MVSKNSETRQCANTNRVSMSVTACKETNMNIVAKSDLNFQGKALVPVSNITGIWLTSSDLAKALQYANSRAVTMIYNKYADEFTSGMTQVLEVSTSGNYRKKVRVFSLRGAHLIAMFARTQVAKEFRRWVLDVLDREVQQSPIAKQFSDEELIGLCYQQLWMENSQKLCKELYPAMKQLRSELSGKVFDIANETRYMTQKNKAALIRETQNLDQSNFVVKHAKPMLAKLRGEEWIH
ncbi:Phage anti-repressor protein [Enterobacter asburiae]|nr:Bro-N domain-containing protein [Enterobacter asburiae]CZV12000.1 Phage anti-repressor protein [Enterobacter asburiae]SAD70319.1 Phage anti-repressor protein [Enterobacter asburiae]SAE23883.1 Phage anti-repressor protein [Enterobacter asburiae]SAF49597.1 Phage anti-repressor protein [Enterobacter asburiae]